MCNPLPVGLTFFQTLLFFLRRMRSSDALCHVTAAIVTAFTLGACASYDPRLNDRNTVYLGAGGPVIDPSVKESLALKKSYWDDSGISWSSFHCHQSHEADRLLYKGSKLVGVSAISSGREGFDTPAGSFKIMQKDLAHASNLYGDYVDAAGNVVVKDVDVKKDTRPPGTTFPRRTDALLHAHHWWSRYASRVSPRCSR